MDQKVKGHFFFHRKDIFWMSVPYQEFCAVLPLCFPTDVGGIVWNYVPLHLVRANYCFFLNSWWKLSYSDEQIHLTLVRQKLLLTNRSFDDLEYAIVPENVLEEQIISFSYYTFCVKVENEEIENLDDLPCSMYAHDMEYDAPILKKMEEEIEEAEQQKAKIQKLTEQRDALRKKLKTLKRCFGSESENESDSSGEEQ